MADKDNEQKRILNIDNKEYIINDMTNYQKSILNDIENYQMQIDRLNRWKEGQVYVLSRSLQEQEDDVIKDDHSPHDPGDEND